MLLLLCFLVVCLFFQYFQLATEVFGKTVAVNVCAVFKVCCPISDTDWKYVALNESLRELVEHVFLSAFIFVGVAKQARQDIFQKKGISGNELVVWNFMVMALRHANSFCFFFLPQVSVNIIRTSRYISHARCSLIRVLCRCISRWISVRAIWKCQTNFCLLFLCSD